MLSHPEGFEDVDRFEMDIRSADIGPGEILFGYTDGVTEARGADGAFFGEKRLLALIKTGAGTAPELLEAVSEDLPGHICKAEQFDDVTMLAVRRKPRAAGPDQAAAGTGK